jgi:hypothetical protein
MRALTDAARLLRLMQAMGRAADVPSEVFFTGGASAVLIGWRASTLDADLKVRPDAAWLFRVIPSLKEELQINVELAAPSDFIPEVPGWRERSMFVARHGLATFFHYDFHAQALAKVERGHALDLADVREMLIRGLVTSDKLRELFEAIEPHLPRFPAIDPPTFRRAVWSATDGPPPGR